MKSTILIVEDELLIALDLKGILEQEGYNVIINIVTVPDAIKAITLHNPILVLLDINLKQDEDGVSLGHYLLNKDTIPYIYITSYSDNVTLDRVKDTRPHGIIIKPFKVQDVKSTIAVVLNNYKHKHIDAIRTDEQIEDEIPFILKGVVEYINSNIYEKIDIHELSAITRWTHQHFIRVFTKYIGSTPYQYILSKKMEKAKVLITETDIPLSGISLDLGFQSYGNFCKIFKKITGKNPDSYRKYYNVNKYINNQ